MDPIRRTALVPFGNLSVIACGIAGKQIAHGFTRESRRFAGPFVCRQDNPADKPLPGNAPSSELA